jgi:hypothetical protein
MNKKMNKLKNMFEELENKVTDIYGNMDVSLSLNNAKLEQCTG